MIGQSMRRYIAIIQLYKSSTLQRLAKDVPVIISLFTKFSNGEQDIAFKSNDGQLFGILFTTRAHGDVIRKQFEESPATQNGDALIIFEAGELAAGTAGFSRTWTWLQRH